MGHGAMMLVAVTLLALAAPAMAQSVSDKVTTVEGFPLPLGLPAPADSGKPRSFVPAMAAPSASCAAVLECRLRVIGAIQRNGAVELNASVLKW